MHGVMCGGDTISGQPWSAEQLCDFLGVDAGVLAEWRALGLGPGCERTDSGFVYPTEHLKQFFARCCGGHTERTQ